MDSEWRSELNASCADLHRQLMVDSSRSVSFGWVLPVLMLAGFGDVRSNAGEFRPRDESEPVRIYMDGQVIYGSDKAWDFEIVSDGSSFYAHEPMSGNASRRWRTRSDVCPGVCGCIWARPACLLFHTRRGSATDPGWPDGGRVDRWRRNARSKCSCVIEHECITRFQRNRILCRTVAD